MSLPLEGVVILDMTRLLPGNYATLLLSGLGADVIKIEERVGGDGVRHMDISGRLVDGESAGHAVLNRGKRSVAIDLKSDRGRQIMLRLVADADALMDSFRPGVLDRLGLGADELKEANPDLVHVSINAFGSHGPYTAIPAHDLNSLGYSGMLSTVSGDDGLPPMPPIQIADLASGLHAALAVVAGLRGAQQTGEMFRADVAMSDAAASLMPVATATLASTGTAPLVPDFLTGRLACYSIYMCGDGLCVTVGGLEPKFFRRMVELMGLPQLADIQYDMTRQEEIREVLAAEFNNRPRAEWLELLAHEDTCVGPVLSIDEALAEPHYKERGKTRRAVFQNGKAVPVFKSIPWLAEGDDDLTAPGHGEHTSQVLGAAGIDAAEVQSLMDEGIVGPAH